MSQHILTVCAYATCVKRCHISTMKHRLPIRIIMSSEAACSFWIELYTLSAHTLLQYHIAKRKQLPHMQCVSEQARWRDEGRAGGGGPLSPAPQPSLRSSDRARDRAIERSTDRRSDRAIERSSDRATERAIERPSDQTNERPSDRGTERPSGRRKS